MEYRTLDLILNSASGLKSARFFGRNDVYAVATVSDDGVRLQTVITTTHRTGNLNPIWNFPMKFTVVEAAGGQNSQILVVKINAVGIFGNKNLGRVDVPIKELLDGVTTEGKAMQIVSYQVITKSGKRRGVLSFKYKIGGKVSGTAVKPVTACPPRVFLGSRKSYSSIGFGAGLLGGFLLSDISSRAASGYGGGCGAVCGGGCSGGGGGCGGGGGGCSG